MCPEAGSGRAAGVVSRAAAASEKFIRAGRSFPGSTVDKLAIR